MKRTFLPIALLLLLPGIRSCAQTSVEMIPTGGYTFPDQVNFYNNYGRIEGAANWGGSLQFNVNRNFGIEFMYNRIDASSGIYNYDYTTQIPVTRQNVAINYIMAGPISSVSFPGSPVHLFFGGELGAAVFEPTPVDYSGNTKFAWGVETGANIYVNPHVGIRMKAQLLSAVGSTGGYYFGYFGGAGAYGYTYPALYQFGLSAGLIIGIGNILPQSRPHVYVPHRRPPPPQPRVYYSDPSPYLNHN